MKHNKKGHNKVKHSLLILKLIMEHGVIKSHEISRILDISERQILKYVIDLRECGFDIQSKTGVNGGYFLVTCKCPLCNNDIEPNKTYKVD